MVGQTTHFGSHRPDRKIPRRPPDPQSRRLAAVGGLIVAALIAVLAVQQHGGSRSTAPPPTPTPPRAERVAGEVAASRTQFLASLTPTPDTDVAEVRTELELQLATLCAGACPRSQGDCSLRNLDIIRREETTLHVRFDLACGPYQRADGRWVYHSPLVQRSASMDRFAGRWLLVGVGNGDPP